MNAAKLALFCTEVFDTLLVLGIASSVGSYKIDIHLIMYKVLPLFGRLQEWLCKSEYGVLTHWY